MKLWKFFGIAGAVLTVGGAVFLFTRPAAAAELGRRGFRVNPECTEVQVIDEEAAKDALVNAAMFHFKNMQQRAIDLIVLALGQALPGCPINDYMKITGIPGVPFGVTVGQLRQIVGDRTLEDVQEMAAKGELPSIPGLEAISPDAPPTKNPIAAILGWTTGGEYP